MHDASFDGTDTSRAETFVRSARELLTARTTDTLGRKDGSSTTETSTPALFREDRRVSKQATGASTCLPAAKAARAGIKNGCDWRLCVSCQVQMLCVLSGQARDSVRRDIGGDVR